MWLKQTDEPLYPEILWSRPENRNGAGRLLIIGGNAHAIAAPATAFAAAEDAGAGAVRVILPDHVRKTFGKFLPEAFFAPSTPSGSFGTSALTELLTQTEWADAVLLAGDFGRNSETASMIEKFVFKYDGLLCITQDTVEHCYNFADKLVVRPNTLIVGSFAQIQKLATSSKAPKSLQFSDGLVRNVGAVGAWSKTVSVCFLTRLGDDLILAKDETVVTSRSKEPKKWRVETAARATVWWLQNPKKQLEAISTSCYIFNSDKNAL